MYRFIYPMICLVVIVPHVVAMDLDDELDELSESVAPAQTSLPSTAGPAPTAPPAAAGQIKWETRPTDAVGVTTINEARGNWFFKGQILKDARALYNKILKKVTAIMPLQEKYIKDHAVVNKMLYEFNQEYGFQSGEMDERASILLEQIKSYESSGALDQEGQAFLAELKTKTEQLEALKKDFNYLQKLDGALSQGLATMSSQLTRANSYEEQAWQHYEKIEEILSDEQAEELLHKMQLAYDNVAAIENYLTESFRVFFATTVEHIKQQIETVKNSIVTLKAHGIALGKKMQELQAKEDEERRIADEQRTRQKLEKERESKRTWLSPIFDAITWVWTSIYNAVSGIYNGIMSWFVKPKVKTVVIEQCPAEAPQAPEVPEIIEEAIVEEQEEPELEEVELPVPTVPQPKPLEPMTGPLEPMPLPMPTINE